MSGERNRWLRGGARATALAIALFGLAGGSVSRAQGIQVAVMPAQLTVTPGAGVDVEIDVTQPGSSFNAFDLVVSYDPAALTFVPASPISLQQGCAMTGACSGACGQTFHVFNYAADSLDAHDALLCNQFALVGPAQIYKLHFTASDSLQITHVHIRRAVFYDAGLIVGPVSTADAAIGIGVPLAVGDPPPTARGPSVAVAPNPALGPVALTIQGVEGPARVDVFDLSGRLVRTLEPGGSGGGPRRLAWDRTDTAGRRVPPGIYLVTLRGGDRTARARLVLLD